MAGKVTRMSKIKQLLQRHRDGASNRSIARELCIYKGTVNDYVNKVAQNNLDVNELLKLDDPVLEALLSAGTPAYLDARFNVFKEQIPYLEKCNKQISNQRFSEKFNQQFSDSDSRPDRFSSLHGV